MALRAKLGTRDEPGAERHSIQWMMGSVVRAHTGVALGAALGAALAVGGPVEAFPGGADRSANVVDVAPRAHLDRRWFRRPASRCQAPPAWYPDGEPAARVRASALPAGVSRSGPAGTSDEDDAGCDRRREARRSRSAAGHGGKLLRTLAGHRPRRPTGHRSIRAAPAGLDTFSGARRVTSRVALSRHHDRAVVRRSRE